jgi:hypothetical protein
MASLEKMKIELYKGKSEPLPDLGKCSDCGKSISAVDSYVKELEEQKAELIEYVNNQADEYEDESARKFLLKHKKYQIQNKPDEHM